MTQKSKRRAVCYNRSNGSSHEVQLDLLFPSEGEVRVSSSFLLSTLVERVRNLSKKVTSKETKTKIKPNRLFATEGMGGGGVLQNLLLYSWGQSSIFLYPDWTKAYHVPARKTSCLIHCFGDKALGQQQNIF